MITSCTESIEYFKESCKLAATNNAFFNGFKRNEIITKVFEHVHPSFAHSLANFILETNFDLTKLSKCKENDEQGAPLTVNLEEPFGRISPSTLRYIKTLSDIIRLHGPTILENKKIIEIGGGYGGLAKVICEYFNVKEYILIDLPEVLMLAEKYLKKYPNLDCVTFLAPNQLKDNETYDYVISTYAFTECRKSVQEIYLEKIVDTSLSGYLLNAEMDNPKDEITKQLGSFSRAQLYERISKNDRKVWMLNETPRTGPNYILAWTP